MSSAEPATVEALQPSPSRISPSMTVAVWCDPSAVTTAEPSQQQLADHDGRQPADAIGEHAEHR